MQWQNVYMSCKKCLSQCASFLDKCFASVCKNVCQTLAGRNIQHSFLDLDLDKCFQLSWLNLCKSMLVDNHFLLKSQKNLFLNLFAIVFFHLEVFYFFTDNYNFKLQLWSVFQLTCFRNVQCSSRGTMFECRLIQSTPINFRFSIFVRRFRRECLNEFEDFEMANYLASL